MSLHQFLTVLRARYRMALLVLLSTVGVTIGVTMLLPEQYTATASVFIDIKSPDPIAGMMLPSLGVAGYVATQVDIIKSDRVAQTVVKMLKLDESATAKEQWREATGEKGKLDVWLAGLLQKKLGVKPSRDSSVINLTYTAVDPGFAAAVANAFTHAYIRTNIELKVEPARQYTDWFGEQGKTLRENLERAQTKLSEFQQKHGIVASDERLDTEMIRLGEISTQLTIVQGQTVDALSKERSGRASDTLPEIVQNSLIQQLKAELARHEGKLEEVGGNFGKNHPQYKRMQSEIASLKQKLEVETQHLMKGFSTSGNVGTDRADALRKALNAQKSKLLQLRQERDELAVLTRDVESAQKAYQAVTQRISQMRLESQSTQTNAVVLTAASEPFEPSTPNIVLNAAGALVLGGLLGIAAAFMLEMLDRRIRSSADLAQLVPLPVLGVIGKSTRRKLVSRQHEARALPAA